MSKEPFDELFKHIRDNPPKDSKFREESKEAAKNAANRVNSMPPGPIKDMAIFFTRIIRDAIVDGVIALDISRKIAGKEPNEGDMTRALTIALETMTDLMKLGGSAVRDAAQRQKEAKDKKPE
jgi:hypothetical protein